MQEVNDPSGSPGLNYAVQGIFHPGSQPPFTVVLARFSALEDEVQQIRRVVNTLIGAPCQHCAHRVQEEPSELLGLASENAALRQQVAKWHRAYEESEQRYRGLSAALTELMEKVVGKGSS
jgi:hypothetical protein